MDSKNAAKKPSITPKALIHQKFGSNACYKVEEVPQPVNSGVPGLVNSQKYINLYRCCLTLPELTVTSDACTKKKDAEQAAAKMAVEKLGIQSVANELTPPEAWRELVARLSVLFSDEFLSSAHPLVGHFKVNLQKNGNMYSRIPLSAVASCDANANNMCKIINPMSESDPLRVASLIWKAAKMSNSVCTENDGEFRIRRLHGYSPEASELLTNCTSGLTNETRIKAIFIPYAGDGNVKSLSLEISNNRYYMDEIAQKLDARDASQLLVSRVVGKASSEMRFYFCVPKTALVSSNSSADIFSNNDGDADLTKLLNIRASYLSGQIIYGDAILANIGYTWKSSDIFYEDVSLCAYYRMLLGKVPDGHYILSREAILAADLPITFTSRTNWRGPLPRDLLCVFCHRHRLLEPIFSTRTVDPSENHVVENCKRIKLPDKHTATKKASDKPLTHKCDVKIMSKNRDLLLECMPDSTYKKESDAIQSVALKVLSWLNKYFVQLDMPIDELTSFGFANDIHVQPIYFCKEFEMLTKLHGAKQNSNFGKNTPLQHVKERNDPTLVDIKGDNSGVSPSSGSLACISYSVMLKGEEDHVEHVIESNDEFEFEIGTGTVISYIESCVTKLSVDQSAKFVTELPSRDVLLAAAGEFAENLANQSLSNCSLEYSVKLLRVTEHLEVEHRMEQALFSPPLAKQRVEFAVRHINDSHSTTLVDFGCGSGSLLDSLLEHTTTLERIVGVDISVKALTHAAKTIHSKLSKNPALQESIKSAILYDGSITDFDSRLYGVDIGTCLEVIEHMEEDQACLFGDVVLSSFCPKTLIVSTPNYEYNPILQKSNKEVDSEETTAGACRFRNHDHKFEWTRKQFEQWANDLAVRHNYEVEFSGVGGNGDVEPGFASQIAVFRGGSNLADGKSSTNEQTLNPYKVLWEWNGV